MPVLLPKKVQIQNDNKGCHFFPPQKKSGYIKYATVKENTQHLHLHKNFFKLSETLVFSTLPKPRRPWASRISSPSLSWARWVLRRCHSSRAPSPMECRCPKLLDGAPRSSMLTRGGFWLKEKQGSHSLSNSPSLSRHV